jgi:hypothetical protein
MYCTVLIFVFVVLAVGQLVTGLDVSWIPSDADGDGPLPLSSSYRQSLRKLCSLYGDKSRPMPVSAFLNFLNFYL